MRTWFADGAARSSLGWERWLTVVFSVPALVCLPVLPLLGIVSRRTSALARVAETGALVAPVFGALPLVSYFALRWYGKHSRRNSFGLAIAVVWWVAFAGLHLEISGQRGPKQGTECSAGRTPTAPSDSDTIARCVSDLKGPSPSYLSTEPLGKLGPRAKEAIPVLIETLRNDRVCNSAMDALRRIGPPGKEHIPLLVEVLAAGRPHARQCAAEMLAWLGPEAEPALPALMEALADKETRGVWAAVARIGDAAVLPLAEALNSENEHLRICALSSLTMIGDKARDAVPALTRFLQIKELSMRCWRYRAVELLGKIGPPAKPATSALWAIHERPYTQRERALVVLALWRIDPGAVDAVGLLTEMLTVDRIPTKTAGAMALGEMGPEAAPAIPALVDLLREYVTEYERMSRESHGHPVAPLGNNCGFDILGPPRAAICALGRIGSAARAALPAMREVLGRVPDREKPAILVSLWKIEPGSVDAVAALTVLLRPFERTNHTTAERAARALGELGPEARTAVPDLIAALEQHGWGGLKEAAASALGKIGEDASSAVPALIQATQGSRQMCLLAVRAMGKIGPAAKSALPELVELATSGPGEELRNAAIEAVRAVRARND